ncbi:peptide ABC transporter substrate-binding protein [Chloroflexota bacterium]
MKRAIYIVVSALLLVSLLAGCTPRKIPTSGGVLNLYGIDPYTLDPAVSSEMTSHGYIMHIFSGLVTLDDNLEPSPDIALEWRVSEDGTVYTFELRQDVRFHDGREVTAEDIKYSWERACNPATGSTTAANFLGDIVGAEAVLVGSSREISGVAALDNYTLQVTIEAPRSYFLFKLSYPTAFVVDRSNVESGGQWWRQPNGTGPFRLGQWQQNSLLTLNRNEYYYREPPNIDLVAYQLWGGMPMDLYETGKIDVTGVNLYYIDKAQDERGSFYRELIVVPELSFFYIGFNTTAPPFDDADIRRAFSLTVDKEKLIATLFRGTNQQADGILPPGIPGYNPDVSGLEFDPAEARELIKNSKYGDAANLPPITLTTAGWGGLISPELEAIINEWRTNLGVEVTVRQLEPERFLYNLKQEKDQIFDAGWVADYPHPQNFLDVLFRTGAGSNYGEYSNAEVDSMLDTAGAEQDYELSLKLYQQVEQMLVYDAACLPLWFGKSYLLVKPYVKGYDLNPLDAVRLNEVYIEPQ